MCQLCDAADSAVQGSIGEWPRRCSVGGPSRQRGRDDSRMVWWNQGFVQRRRTPRVAPVRAMVAVYRRRAANKIEQTRAVRRRCAKRRSRADGQAASSRKSSRFLDLWLPGLKRLGGRQAVDGCVSDVVVTTGNRHVPRCALNCSNIYNSGTR